MILGTSDGTRMVDVDFTRPASSAAARVAGRFCVLRCPLPFFRGSFHLKVLTLGLFVIINFIVGWKREGDRCGKYRR